MKYASTLLLFAFVGSIHAQVFINPFQGKKNTFSQKDIFLLWNAPGSDQLDQRVFRYDWIAHNGGQSNNLILPDVPTTSVGASLGTGRFVSTATGRFNDDARDDIFYLIENSTGWQCGLSGLQTTFVPADSSYTYQSEAPTGYEAIPIAANNGFARSTVGDFDGDGTDEVAIAWWEPTGDLVHIQILDADNSLTLHSRAAISDQISLRVNGQYNAYDLSSGDLNGDGADELILTGLEASASGDANYQVFVKVYEVNNPGCTTITPKAHMVVDDAHIADDTVDGFQLGYAQTAVASLLTHADTLPDQGKDILSSFDFVYGGDPQFSYNNFFQYLLRATPDLSTLSIIDTTWSFLSSADLKAGYPLEAKTGDLNGDRTEDAVLLTKRAFMFTVMNDVIQPKGSIGGIVLDDNNGGITESVDRLEVGDIDEDERDEIVTFSHGFPDVSEHNFFVNVWGVDDNFQADTLTGGSYQFTDNASNSLRSYGIALGNLDGNDLMLGQPIVRSCEYTQPVFVIGAIPSHFDVLDGVQYDVNNCYPVQDCQMAVQITQTGSTSTQAAVEITSDWAVSSSLDVNVSKVLGVGTNLSAKYGVKFDKVNTQTNSQSVTVAISATADDMVQYLKIPVTLWQYPVLDAAHDTSTWILASFPADNLSPQTIVANGKSLFNYTPDHEVGNLLSYPGISSNYDNVGDLPNTAGNWIILGAGSVPNYTMSPSGGITYTLETGTELDWSQSDESYQAANMGISTLGFGLGLDDIPGYEYLNAPELPGDYPPNAFDLSELSMYSNHISQQTEFRIAPTNIIGSPNEFNYVISPKIYWNDDGAGMVKFDLDMDSQPGSGSFWSQAYTTKPDPALNLPYRYEQVINPDLSNTTNLLRTKSMRFSTPQPNIGDTVDLFLRVFNYSFMATPSPVEFKLYHGDPDQVGTPVTAVDGTTLFHTSVALGARGREEVEVRFLATTAMVTDDFDKIYAVLDPNNLVDEIHEENNNGWAQLGYSCNLPGSVVAVDEIGPARTSDSWIDVYPVPASEQVVIAHDLRGLEAKGAYVSVHDLLGQEVARFDISSDYPGKIYWNTRAIAPGSYTISVIDQAGVRQTKMAMVTR